MSTLAFSPSWRYGVPVTVNPVAGFGDPSNLAHKRPIRLQALFLCPPFRVMAAVRGRPKGLPGSKFPVRQPAHGCHPSFGDDSRQLQTKLGAPPMQTTRNPSTHAAAWKARAFAALRSDSSLSVRLARYNAAMARAREIEARANAGALQIRPAGGMWRVCQGDAVLAFAASYRAACQRLAALEAVGGAQ